MIDEYKYYMLASMLVGISGCAVYHTPIPIVEYAIPIVPMSSMVHVQGIHAIEYNAPITYKDYYWNAGYYWPSCATYGFTQVWRQGYSYQVNYPAID